ncbi:MAG TPA: dTDP-4-dehydrorhamnose 3,5-epimerase [Candidatus Corynebacterium gallistercoris]|uniref:dTDP-4-dehydrorhamnose 3,5-epimerase n=1 Tax=Candidatus Corynebacterium gallistercoris TaxID=2838530 RepID=A0A9D1RZW9_9CORY|nr:dTDP-4-dehydrorhamnose 3,5-epimerase [Candidatus Corynebacterium gallistercoris]
MTDYTAPRTTSLNSAELDRALAEDAPGTIVELPIAGAWAFIPQVFGDDRGGFHEWFRAEQFTEQLGYPLQVVQANLSRSAAGVLRGIHLAEVPPGQAKFVTCVAGEVRDVLVDLRQGSPTFGQHLSVELSAENNIGVYVPLGVGHGFVANEQSTVSYLVTEAYSPEREFEVDAFDPDLAIDWGIDPESAIRSGKDQAAPGLKDVTERLPRWREVRGWEKELADGWAEAMQAAEDWEEEQ